jgi:mannobiose 2-epimerase
MDLETYGRQVEEELLGNILPFHAQFCVDHTRGGFIGRIDNNRTPHPDAPKGLVQHGRILWSFAHAYRIYQDQTYLTLAKRANDFLLAHFQDEEEGGFFWQVDAAGQPTEMRKMIYGQAFAIYGFAEYALAAGDEQSKGTAVTLYDLLEEKVYDPEHGGYFDAFDRAWRLTPKINVDQAAGSVSKTMNTHLHLLEAYTNLYRIWPDARLRQSLQHLIKLHMARIISESSGQLGLHFDTQWRPVSDHVSPGHDIEASWLLVEAAEVLGDPALLQGVLPAALRLAQATLAAGLGEQGDILGEDPAEATVWWAQAEAMVGFLNAYQLSGAEGYLEASLRCWRFTQDNLIDRRYGEWFYGLDLDGQPLPKDRAGEWKTPYHSGRACMEVKQRIDRLVQSPKSRVRSR